MSYDSKRCSFPPGRPKPPEPRRPPEPPPAKPCPPPPGPASCPPSAPTAPCTDTPFAFLTQSGRLEVCLRSGEIPFCGECLLGAGFIRDGGRLRLLIPGIYRAEYILTFPALQTLNTVFSLQADGRNLPGSILRVWKPPGSGSVTVSAQVIWESACPSMLRVSSSRAFRLNSPGPSDTMASLSVFRL